MSRLRTLGLILLLAVPVRAGVLVVDAANGPGTDYTSIPSAIAAAAPGDVLLVRTGDYGGFDIDGKGISIIADAGAVVKCGPSLLTLSSVQNVPAGQTVLLRGLSFSTYWLLGSGSNAGVTVSISNCAGNVWIEECSIDAGNASLDIDTCEAVALVRCSISGAGGYGGKALATHGSTVFVDRGSFSGGAGKHGALGPFGSSASPALPGGDGLRVEGGTVSIFGATLTGGPGGNGWTNLVYCAPPQDGGDGLELFQGAPLVRVADCVLQGGAPGNPVSCAPPASAGLGLQVLSGSAPLLGVIPPSIASSPVVREGQSASVTLTGAAGDFALFLLAGTSHMLYLAPFQSALLLGAPFVLQPLGLLPAGGSIALSATVQDLGPGVEGGTLHVQSATCNFGSGSCVLGSASALLLLDAAL